jgi:DNA invertase Pin-like site-specific DNA recombinase
VGTLAVLASSARSKLLQSLRNKTLDVQHLAQLIGQFESHRTALVVTSQGIDTSESSPGGRFQMHVLAAVAEFERSILSERVRAGVAAARERGVRFGRPSVLDQHIAKVAKLKRAGLSEREIACKLSIPRGSVSRVIKLAREEKLLRN